LVGTILNILCPQERRVFQSKLGVSSSNQCNLHHSPHTVHLGKNKKIKKKGTLFFGHGVLSAVRYKITFSFLYILNTLPHNIIYLHRMTCVQNPARTGSSKIWIVTIPGTVVANLTVFCFCVVVVQLEVWCHCQPGRAGTLALIMFCSCSTTQPAPHLDG